MKNQFVLASFDINCTWKKIAPVYRILVNNELFAERQWRWRDHYLTEVLQICHKTRQDKHYITRHISFLISFRLYMGRQPSA
jgi:hypothetical protein